MHPFLRWAVMVHWVHANEISLKAAPEKHCSYILKKIKKQAPGLLNGKTGFSVGDEWLVGCVSGCWLQVLVLHEIQ